MGSGGEEEEEGETSPGASPLPPPLLNTIQSEQSSVALSTFSSASKCQAVFSGENAVALRGGASKSRGIKTRSDKQQFDLKKNQKMMSVAASAEARLLDRLDEVGKLLHWWLKFDLGGQQQQIDGVSENHLI